MTTENENETYAEFQEFFERENALFEIQNSRKREMENMQTRKLYSILVIPAAGVSVH
jgi:hypothetical protein